MNYDRAVHGGARAEIWLYLQDKSNRRLKNISIATDGSELAEHAVKNGLSLAKSVGANVYVMIVDSLLHVQRP